MWPNVCRQCTTLDWSWDTGAIRTTGKSTLTKLSRDHWPEGTAWHSSSKYCSGSGIQTNLLPGKIALGSYCGIYMGGGAVYAEFYLEVSTSIAGTAFGGIFLSQGHNFHYPAGVIKLTKN